MTFQTYNVNGNVTSVDLASSVNINGTYFNGPTDNGVNSTLIPTSVLPLVIDNINVNNGDEILLTAQTNGNQNGIYIFIDGILKRRNDFQCIEQIKGGQYISVSNGQINKGIIFVIADPLPIRFGIDPLFVILSTKLIRDFSIDVNSVTPGVFFSITSNLSDSQVINQAGAFLAAINGRVFIQGSTLAQVLTGIRGGFFATGGTYTFNSGILAGVYSSLNFQAISATTIINGARIYAFYGIYEFQADITTDASKFSMIGLSNPQSSTIGQMIFLEGNATCGINISDPSNTYTGGAGVAAGSAGDPTKCNANKVVKIILNNIVGFIPVFNSNA